VASRRAKGPFVAVDCSALPSGLIDSELARAAAEERFRADLYYRLNVFPIRIPPLRERREDIGLLARHFAPGQSLSAEALALLQGHNWPGNVRELEHAVQRAAFLAKGGEIRPEYLLLESSREEVDVAPAGPFLPLAESSASTWPGCWPTPAGRSTASEVRPAVPAAQAHSGAPACQSRPRWIDSETARARLRLCAGTAGKRGKGYPGRTTALPLVVRVIFRNR
jgi:transcriptional regulator with GAF, ATPase, and Fis domain